MATFTQEEIHAMVAKLELDGGKVSTKVPCDPFINGKYVSCLSGERFPSRNPATGEIVAEIASCGTIEINQAVIAARAAFENGCWSDLPPSERKAILLRFANLIEENLLELAVLDTIEAGKPISDNIKGDVPGAVACFKYHAEAIDKLYDHVSPTGPDNLALVRREPVGVCGFLVPWNFPLLMATWKLAPALATGNCCVLKPAELTSLSALRLAGLAKQAGIPDGVLNVVPGLGPQAGAALSEHMDVDFCGFTGSTRVGHTVLRAAADSNLKRVSLECGGKSAQIVFDDIEDLDETAEHVMEAAFWNMGENCSCGSRLVVQKNVKTALLEKLVRLAKSEKWKVGNPLDLNVKLGSMISPQHCEKVMGYVQKGKECGANLILGGHRILEETGGDFVEITIFDEVKNSDTIAQEEIFGPVLSVIQFESEVEAVAIANDTQYGLAASLYTSNVNRATRVARKLRAGNVSVNCFAEGDDTTPFGGYKQSGFVGRDKSIFAHEQYTELKTIWYEISNS